MKCSTKGSAKGSDETATCGFVSRANAAFSARALLAARCARGDEAEGEDDGEPPPPVDEGGLAGGGGSFLFVRRRAVGAKLVFFFLACIFFTAARRFSSSFRFASATASFFRSFSA